MHGLASLLKSLSFPTFANWRWATLPRACREVQKVFEALAANFDPAPFRNEDKSKLRKVCFALSNNAWALQFSFVTWLAGLLGDLLQWGGGCECHEAERLRGEAVGCPNAGRRLRSAYQKACQVVTAALREANAWVAADWGGLPLLVASLQGCVRGMCALSLRKIAYLDRIPYLLARLCEPGIRQRCEAQWAAVPPEGHHRVSHEFLNPAHDSGLQPLVAAINPDGANVDPRLRDEIRSVERIPLDDAIAEGPHAAGKAEWQRITRANFPWVASTMRTQQNLADMEEMAPLISSLDLQTEWNRYSSVLQDGKHQRRARKITLGDLQENSICWNTLASQVTLTSQVLQGFFSCLVYRVG